MRLPRASAVLLAALVLLASHASVVGAVADRAVSVAGFAFNPNVIDIETGDSVVWTNNDSATHNVVGTGFASPSDFAPGETYRHTFTAAGVYTYQCTLHSGMSGVVRVLHVPEPVVPEVAYPATLAATATALVLWATRRSRRAA